MPCPDCDHGDECRRAVSRYPQQTDDLLGVNEWQQSQCRSSGQARRLMTGDRGHLRAPLAGQRVTLRLDGPVAHVLAGGVLPRTVACPVPPGARPRLRGARPGTAQPPRLPEPLVVTRRVSVRGSVMVGGQKIQVGLTHARKTVQVTVGPDTYHIAVETGITVTAARSTSRDIRRHKASNYD
jgi:hypothetical protein